MLYITMKFHENILTIFTRNYHCLFSKGSYSKNYRQELRFLCCAHRPMMLYISMKFHENILKGFQVIERTRNDHCQILTGNNYKTIDMSYDSSAEQSSDDALCFYEV